MIALSMAKAIAKSTAIRAKAADKAIKQAVVIGDKLSDFEEQGSVLGLAVMVLELPKTAKDFAQGPLWPLQLLPFSAYPSSSCVWTLNQSCN